MNILQVSATDFGGGAAKVAWDLNKAYQAVGYHSWIAVGKKKTGDPSVFQIPNEEAKNIWESLNFAAAAQTKKLIGVVRGAGLVTNFFNAAARYRNTLDYLKGCELFDYPGTRKLLQLLPQRPDLVHAHNLHSKYFDLRLLPEISQQMPTVLTLHDTWLLSGHCAYAKTCNRWRTGCGSCPDLSLYPAVRRDNTAQNWQIKKDLYAHSKLYVVTPCKWLMNKVKASMLQPGIRLQKVIHNGVDTEFFHSGDKAAARHALGLDQQEFIVFFVANSVRNNIWKDFATLKRSMELVSSQRPGAKIRLICFGDESVSEYAGHIPIDFVPHTDNLSKLVYYYQAVDVYVHATKADTFPTVILEALACGLPVIATAVDGVGEQIKSLVALKSEDEFGALASVHSVNEATGVLVERGSAQGIAHWLEVFLDNKDLRLTLGLNARKSAQLQFDFRRQVQEYLSWYENSIQHFKGPFHAIEHNRSV